MGRDVAGRTIIQLAVDDWVLEKLMTFEADAAELDPEHDDEGMACRSWSSWCSRKW